MFTAVRGGGASVDGQPLRRSPAPTEVAEMHGVAITRLLGPAPRRRVEERLEPVRRTSANRGAAGINYPLVAEGELDFVFCWRTLVWDHAAGVLLLEEAGGRAARLDGSDYEPWSDRSGLVFAADPATSSTVSALLAPGGEP
jgi:fructose-1,6-bisphosphatase/inositol monophosphatase family enzyme